MTRPRVKICGITRSKDAELAVDLGADAIGFVLWDRSPRHVSAETAEEIARLLPPFVTRVGVIVNMSPEDVSTSVRTIGLDVAQLHGDEDVEAYANVPARLVKVVSVDSEDDVARALALPATVTLLVDATDRSRRGGTGERANWVNAARLARARRVILAGGLTPENVRDAIAQVQPWAIDVSSGVEASPGIKDPDRLRAFFRALQ